MDNYTQNETFYKTYPQREHHESFFRDVFNTILEDAVFEGLSRENPVVRFQLPEKLTETLSLTVGEEPQGSHTQLLDSIKEVIKYSVKTGHPHFVNQLYSGMDPYGLCAEWVAAALNASVYTYEVAPVFTLMELEIFEKMRQVIGFPEGKGDGLFCPGGSIANGYAISVARYKKQPLIKEQGLSGFKPLVMFVSEDAHYSFKKLASFQGLGMDNVVGIKVDAIGKILIDDLEEKIQAAINENKEPFLVCATAGTTVLGAFDPIPEMADICKKYKLWFHVDAAWGGGALMSKTHRRLMNGIERADSVTWNPHKLLCAPQQCSTLLLKDEKIASETHATYASYLFQTDKFYDASNYDTGDKHIQCGRRADVFKFWLMWKAKGIKGFETHIDYIFSMAAFALDEIKSRAPAFKLLLEEPECTNVTFWYIPPSLRDLDPDSEEYRQKIHKVAPEIKRKMMESGSMMVTYQPLKEHPNFFRLVVQSSEVTQDDIKYFLDTIESYGDDL